MEDTLEEMLDEDVLRVAAKLLQNNDVLNDFIWKLDTEQANNIFNALLQSYHSKYLERKS